MYLILHVRSQPLLEFLVQRRDLLDGAFLRGDLGDFVLKTPRLSSTSRAAMLHDGEPLARYPIVDQLGLDVICSAPRGIPHAGRKVDSNQANSVAGKLLPAKRANRHKPG